MNEIIIFLEGINFCRTKFCDFEQNRKN